MSNDTIVENVILYTKLQRIENVLDSIGYDSAQAADDLALVHQLMGTLATGSELYRRAANRFGRHDSQAGTK